MSQTNLYCEHCGNKIDSAHQFCTKCGQSTIPSAVKIDANKNSVISVQESWWQRLFKVIYILLYIPLLLAIIGVWSANSSTYDYFTKTYHNTSGTAFWYSLLTLLIGMVIIRLIKITFLYIVSGIKPEWKKEFKRFY